MKKAISVVLASVFVSLTYAQDVNFSSVERTEPDKVMNLSADQIAKIKKLNREIGPKFKAIGQSNLSGYEKGQKKRALALEHKAAIRAILTESQMNAWESRYGNTDRDEGLRDVMKDYYEVRLERLEKKFEKDKKAIEKSGLSKNQKKDKVKALKKHYKLEKERLKEERDQSVISGVFKE